MTFSVLGKDEQNNDVRIFQKDRREGLYIIGATGTGKSTLLENLILQDINQQLGVCVLDPHGDLVNAVISRMEKRLEDVILIDVGSRDYVTGLNLFHCEHPEDPFEAENVVQAVMHILEKVYQVSRDTPLMNQYFINITRTLIYNPQATVLDIPRLLTDAAFRESLLANVPEYDDDVHWFWTELYEQHRRGKRLDEIISAITNKLVEFNSRVLKPWFGQNAQTLNLRRIMDDRKILLVKLKARWQSMTSLIGSIFIAQILDAAYSREDTPVNKRKQFNVYADEFQTFASQDFAQLFTEARKYGIGITISHQVFEQLDDTIKATIKQAANIVVFRVSSDNAKEIAGEFDCSPQPGIPRYEPLRTPVMEPIQYMITKGIHPQVAIRQFIEQYGKLLIEKAKREEDIGRDARHETQRYNHDLAIQALRNDYNASLPQHSTLPYSVGFVTPPSITASQEWRDLLKGLNALFYESMLSGKAGRNPEHIPIPSELLDAFIRAMNLDGKRFLDLKDAYEGYVASLGIQIADIERRYQYLQLQEADLQNVLKQLQAFQQTQASSIKNLKNAIKEEEKREEDAAIRSLLCQFLTNFAQEAAIVELNRTYYITYLREVVNPGVATYSLFTGTCISWEQYTTRYGYEGLPHLEDKRSASFPSLQAAIDYYSDILNKPRLLKTKLGATNSWQMRQGIVSVTNFVWCNIPPWIMSAISRNGKKAKGFLREIYPKVEYPIATYTERNTLRLNVQYLI